MAEKYVTLNDEDGQPIYPETRAEVVKTAQGETLEEALKNIEGKPEVEVSGSAPTEETDTKVFYEVSDEEGEEVELVEEAPLDGKAYARKNGTWVDSGASLAGNVTTHTHDRVVQTVGKETDVWDGTTVSASLQGTGTEEDPYQINSCADWVHFIKNGGTYAPYAEEEPSSFRHMVINKNLDFGGHEIDLTGFIDAMESSEDPPIFLYMYLHLDGKGSALKNYQCKGWHIWGMGYLAVIHDVWQEGTFVMDLDKMDVLWGETGDVMVFGLTSGVQNIVDAPFDLGGDILMYNAIVKDKVKFTATKPPVNIKSVSIVGHCCQKSENEVFGIKISTRNVYTHLEYEMENSGTDFLLFVISIGELVPADRGESVECYAYDTGESVNIGSSGPTVETGLAVSHISCMSQNGGSQNKPVAEIKHMYRILSAFEDLLAEADSGTPKTLEEMKQPAFLALLNESGDNIWKADTEGVNGGLPVLDNVKGSQKVAYDGYVRQSEFEAFKKEGGAGAKEPYYLPDKIALFFFDNDQTAQNTTQEDFLAAMGGWEGMEKLYSAVESGRQVAARVMDGDVTVPISYGEARCNKVEDNGNTVYAVWFTIYAWYMIGVKYTCCICWNPDSEDYLYPSYSRELFNQIDFKK